VRIVKELRNLSLISLANVYKEYILGEVTVSALKDVSLELPAGKFVALIGPSGSGKTTLLNIISSIDVPTRGKIQIDDIDITYLTRKQRAQFRRDKVGFIFQFFNLIPSLTALENVEFSLVLSGVKTKNGKKSFDNKVIRKVAIDWLTKVGLKDRSNHFPSQLSGGEQQRVAIARALAKDPPIIVADEPSGNLDYKNGIKILQLMKDLNKSTNKTFIIATHNQQIAKISDIIINLQSGHVQSYEQDQPKDVKDLFW